MRSPGKGREQAVACRVFPRTVAAMVEMQVREDHVSHLFRFHASLAERLREVGQLKKTVVAEGL